MSPAQRKFRRRNERAVRDGDGMVNVGGVVAPIGLFRAIRRRVLSGEVTPEEADSLLDALAEQARLGKVRPIDMRPRRSATTVGGAR